MKTLLPFLMTAFALAAVAPAEAEAQGKRGKHKVIVHVDDGYRVDIDDNSINSSNFHRTTSCRSRRILARKARRRTQTQTSETQ